MNGTRYGRAAPASSSGRAPPSLRPLIRLDSSLWMRNTSTPTSRRNPPATTPATLPSCAHRWKAPSSSSAPPRRRWRASTTSSAASTPCSTCPRAWTTSACPSCASSICARRTASPRARRSSPSNSRKPSASASRRKSRSSSSSIAAAGPPRCNAPCAATSPSVRIAASPSPTTAPPRVCSATSARTPCRRRAFVPVRNAATPPFATRGSAPSVSRTPCGNSSPRRACPAWIPTPSSARKITAASSATFAPAKSICSSARR